MKAPALAALVALALPATLLAAAPAASAAPARHRVPVCTAAQQTPGYLCGNPLLGPWPLPDRTEPMAGLLKSYVPLGPYTSRSFLAVFRNDSSWIYPPFDGFDVTVENGTQVVDRHPYDLSAGSYLDRFGSPRGRFLARGGDGFEKRALPPDSLNTYDPAVPQNYHCYRVLKDFKVDAGPIRPWFGQPGRGTQYLLAYDTQGQATGSASVQSFLDGSYLRDAPPTACTARPLR